MTRLALTLATLATLAALAACATPPPAPQRFPAAAGPPPPAAPTAHGPRPEVPPPAAAQAGGPPAVHERSLPNGLRVVLVEQHARPVVKLRLVLAQGSLGDPPAWPGAGYFATALFGDYHELDAAGERILDEKSLRRQLAEIGAQYSSSTEADRTVLGIDGYARDLPRYLDELSKALLNPRCGEQSFIGRREAMIDTIEDLELADEVTFYEALSHSAFGSGHPYARSPFGTKKSIDELPYEVVKEHQARLLSPRGATLLVVGDMEASAFLAKAEAALTRWRGANPPALRPPAAPKVKPRASVAFIPRTPASILTLCATRALSDVTGQDAAIEVLTTLLGHGHDARLLAALREKAGLSYAGGAWLVARRHARGLTLCAKIRAEEAERGTGLFLEVLEELRAQPPEPAELEWAKAVVLSDLESTHDTLDGSLEHYLRALIFGAELDLARRQEDVRSVSAGEVQQLAARILDPTSLQLVVSGEPGRARAAVSAHKLGAISTVRLFW